MTDTKAQPRCAGVNCIRRLKCLRFWDKRTGWVDQMNPATCKKYLEVKTKEQLNKIIHPQRTL